MIIAYFAYTIGASAVGIGIGFIVAKTIDLVKSYIDTKKMTKADEIEARR